MLNEALKWLHGLAAGVAVVLYEYLQHVPTHGMWEMVAVAALVRLAGLLVAKIPA